MHLNAYTMLKKHPKVPDKYYIMKYYLNIIIIIAAIASTSATYIDEKTLSSPGRYL